MWPVKGYTTNGWLAEAELQATKRRVIEGNVEAEVGDDNERDEGQNRPGSKLDDDRNEEESLSTVMQLMILHWNRRKWKWNYKIKRKGHQRE